MADGELHWFEAHGIGKRRMKIKRLVRTIMSDRSKQFAACIRNDDYEESLELRKIYEILADPEAEKHKMIRVIDEEGEDYLYPEDWFLRRQLPS